MDWAGAWQRIKAVLLVARDLVWAYVQEHPGQTLLVMMFIVGLMGVVIDTGWRGVLFRWGRFRKVLDPGFHPLVPWMHTVRKTHIRARTMDLAKQRATSADGLVYDVDANLVYRIDDPVKALIEIDAFKQGIETVLSIAVQELIRERDHDQLWKRDDLDRALRARLDARFTEWGLSIDRVGFTTIAPTDQTLRITQQDAKVRERDRVRRMFLEAGVRPATALALIGAEPVFVSHGHARYRLAQRRAVRALVDRRRLAALERTLAQAKPREISWDDLEDEELDEPMGQG